MASVYTNDLRLEEIGSGEQSGAWGDTTNTNLELIAEAFAFLLLARIGRTTKHTVGKLFKIEPICSSKYRRMAMFLGAINTVDRDALKALLWTDFTRTIQGPVKVATTPRLG